MRPRARTAFLVLVTLAVFAWVAAVAVLARSAFADASAAASALSRLDGREVLFGGDRGDDLSEAERRLASAASTLDSPVLWPLRPLPVVGRQWRSARALATSGRDTAEAVAVATEDSRDILEDAGRGGEARVRSLHSASRVLDRVHQTLGGLDLGPEQGLIGPLRRQRERFSARLTEVIEALGEARTATSAAAELLAGPRAYLVVAANQAEMRAGHGMLLSGGVLRIEDGRPSIEGTVSTPDLPRPAEPPPLAGDHEARWGWLQPNTEWRNLGLTPRFDVTAELAAEMWERSVGGEIDGVIALDATALARLLSVTGPVTIDGRTVGADDAVAFVTRAQYVETPELSERRDRLSDLAVAVVEALERPLDPVELGRALSSAVRGRHLLGWSDGPDEDLWETVGATGRLPEDGILVTVLNRGGNKLDPYLDVDVGLTVEEGVGRLDIHLENDPPADAPRYVVGPHPDLDVEAGTYVGYVAVWVPAGGMEIDGDPTLVAAGSDGPLRMVAWEVRLARGAERSDVLRFRLPDGVDELTLVPSARMRPVGWEVHGERFSDERPRRIDVAG